MAQVSDPAKARSVATEIVTLLRGAGFVAYFAGGCVRDELLGLHPSDYDVATSATPRQIEGVLKQPRFATHFVGEAFGVTLAKADGVPVEVATFRSDGTYTDKRRPDSVVFSTPEHDAQRRDFTINALFLDPLADVRTPATNGAMVAGEVIDLVGGVADLRAGLIRAVGDAHARLREDHLRAIRAVRFAARFGFSIEKATAEAISAHAADLEGVSRERIGEELRRMLLRAGPARLAAARILEELGLDRPVFGPVGGGGRLPARFWAALAAVQPKADFGTVLAAVLVERQMGSGPGWWMEAVTNWRKALCLSNEELAALVGTLECLAQLQFHWVGATVASQKRLAAREHFAGALDLWGALNPGAAAAARARFSELQVIGPGINPPPILSGVDLIAAGQKPGPDFKRLLDLAYDAQLEGRISDLAGAMELVRQQRI